MIIGTKLINTDNITEGNSRVTTPIMTLGILFNHTNQETSSRYEMLDMIPTPAMGIAQEMIRAAMEAMAAYRRMIRCHQERPNDFQITSSGRTPM